MKKLLLTMLAVVFSTAMFAQLQKIDLGEKVNFSQRQKAFSVQNAPSALELYVPGQKDTPMLSPASGLYFFKPAGSLYSIWDLNGGGFYNAILALPALRDGMFINKSTNPANTRWYFNGADYTDDYADSDWNFHMSLYPVPGLGYGWDGPELWNSAHTESYVMPTYYSADGYPARVASYAEMEWLAFTEDMNTGLWGALDNDNMCGSGTYTEDGVTYKSTAVYQNFPKPAAPLYVEEMYLEGISITGTPLKNGATLDLNIYDAETDELLGTFTATADDWILWETGNRNSKLVSFGLLVFKHTIQGAFGDENEPITIDRATRFELVGFDNDDVDFGPSLAEVNESDTGDFPGQRESAARVIFEDNSGEAYSFYYMDATTVTLPCVMILNLGFYSIMDYIHVADELIWNSSQIESGYSILQVGETIDDCHTYGKEGTDYDLGALYVEVACPWIDPETKAENYYIDIDEWPDWITGMYYDDYYYDDYCVVYVAFTAEALPSGVTGRVASFRLKGRGYTDDTYVVVVQGDGDPTGIESIPAAATTSSTSKGTYNLAGQRVSDSAKGILVRDGKKFINK